MYAVAFKSQDNKQLNLSVVGDAGYALILPWMLVPVSMITLTQVVSGTSTVVARAAIGREIPDLKHLALTVDGTTAKVYFRGRLLMVGTLSTTMTIDKIELQGGTKDTLLSEMLLMPRVASQEDIAMWHNLRAPFYDPSPHIPAEHQPVTVKGAGADIDIDKYGIRATRKADGKKTFEIDAETGDAFFRGDITGASGTFGGSLKAKMITADMYGEIRNVLPYTGQDSLDQDSPIDVDFYIPSETVNIVSVTLSAKALRYRAYAKTASSGGSHNHDVTIPAHTHVIRPLSFVVEYIDTGLGGDHDHGGSTGSTSTDTSYEGDHDHTYYEATGTDSDSHYHSILEMYGETDTHTHSHSITEMQNTTGSNGAHSHTVSHHSHSISVDAGHTHHYLRIIDIRATTTEASEVELITSDYSDSHVHDLDYGIALDTTPADVRLYCANGGDFDTGQSLLSAPADPTIEYVLAEELNLTDKFTGGGWKKIRFTSSRRGRITWQLIVKLDITA